MPSEQDNTALAAIIIAIIAFLVTTGQLLQQVFGTAVGYRHCQASVIGDWATLTRRKWRWSEFRFETRFTTPNIRLVQVADRARLGKVRLITGDLESRRRTYVTSISNPDDDEEGGDQVGWLALLDQLHMLQSGYDPEEMRIYGATYWPMQRMSCPAITLRERSWDFIPPDIIRPVATSTVGDIIALAHRLGMEWSDLRPGDGIMRAEGGGKSIVSTAVRGFGILLHFNCDRAGRDNNISPGFGATIQSVSADKLGFGILESWDLLTGDIIFEGANETEAAKAIMHALRIDRVVVSKYGEYMEQSGNSLGFSDILGMCARFMPLQGSSITRVLKVHRDVDRGPTCSLEGFDVFQLRLWNYEQERACSEQMLYLLSTYRRLDKDWGIQWRHPGNEVGTLVDAAKFLDELRKLSGEVMNRIQRKYSSTGYFIRDLVASHITQALECPDLARATLNDTAQRRKIVGGLSPMSMNLELAAGMHLYIDRIPLVVSLMKDRGFHDERRVIDTWWSLIFRAMLWHRGHRILKGKTRGYGGIPVSPSFWGSKLPVYIA